ncbi:DUF1254 domain-containing protein [Mycolicibacterium moriokaense]|nr:DUF1254 domain-containing protein [Mycolicibacterium moriokaense]
MRSCPRGSGCGRESVAGGFGWLLAGRVLRPLQEVTATTRRVADRHLHERISLDGPDDEIKELADTFDDILERLDRAFDGQHRFVANASHELRTPLAINRTLIVIAGPGDPGELPADVPVIKAATPHVWIIGRTQTNGAADYPAVHKVRQPFCLRNLTGEFVGEPDWLISSSTVALTKGYFHRRLPVFAVQPQFVMGGLNGALVAECHCAPSPLTMPRPDAVAFAQCGDTRGAATVEQLRPVMADFGVIAQDLDGAHIDVPDLSVRGVQHEETAGYPTAPAGQLLGQPYEQ